MSHDLWDLLAIRQTPRGVCNTCIFLPSCSLRLLAIHAAMCRFDGFAEETVTVQRLPGWFKQRSNRLYPVRALMRWMLATTCTLHG